MHRYPDEEESHGFYPGSTRRLSDKSSVSPRLDRPVERWDEVPKIRKVKGGGEVELFTIGQLASALHRQAVTLRKWETLGWIPKAAYRSSGDTFNGNRRYYSREQVEGLIQIAEQEGIMNPRAGKSKVSETNFVPRAYELWRSLGHGSNP